MTFVFSQLTTTIGLQLQLIRNRWPLRITETSFQFHRRRTWTKHEPKILGYFPSLKVSVDSWPQGRSVMLCSSWLGIAWLTGSARYTQ